MNNRDKYKKAFSVLHASETNDWEALMEQKLQWKAGTIRIVEDVCHGMK